MKVIKWRPGTNFIQNKNISESPYFTFTVKLVQHFENQGIISVCMYVLKMWLLLKMP